MKFWPRSTRFALPAAIVALLLTTPGLDRVSHAAPPAAPGAFWQRADPATEARVKDWARGGSGWIPNRGQMADASGQPATDVLFATTRPGSYVVVTTHGISHYFISRPAEQEHEAEHLHPGMMEEDAPESFDWARLDVTLEGARIRPDRMRPSDPIESEGLRNYYLAHCPTGVRDVPSYASVTFPDVYHGIDWVVRSTPEAGVHHDFVVHPGADAARIRLAYGGATAIELSDDGRSLIVRTSLGEVREGSIACSQDGGRTPIQARFVKDGDVVRVDVGAYDRSKPLVIDPPLVWSTYYGGNSFDGPRAVYCDNTNNVIYVVGYTDSNTMPTLPGGGYYNGTAPGDQDGFIWKFDQQGVRLWATYFGGDTTDFIADCVVDASGNLWAGGNTLSTNMPTANPGGGALFQGANGGATDGFLLEFGPSGALLWSTYYGGAGSDYIQALTPDPSGRVFAVGSSSSTGLTLADPGGGALYQTTPAGLDALILKFNASRMLEWGTLFGGSNYDDLGGVVTANGSLYAVGFTQSSTFPTLDPGGGAYYQSSLVGSSDAVIARFTTAGVQTWTTLYGGNNLDTADQPVVDANGNLFVWGDTYSTNFQTQDPGGGAYYQATNAGAPDFFLLEFNAANQRVWATYYGGSNLEILGFADRPLAIDAQGNIYVTGMTLSSNIQLLNPGGGAHFQTFTGDRDGMIAEFSNTGVMLWATCWGSDSFDFGCGVAVGAGGCLFATGEVTGSVGFATANPGGGAWYTPTSLGSHEGYIAKFCTANSSCCIDNTCAPVSTAAQCTALGGQQFNPGQPCSTVVCTIDCTICGRKFNDLNRNGVQDNGEPGLSGWSISLYYPNGPLYGTTVTGANGDYCFTGLPCGTWVVNEVQQPGWVQTAPNGTHTVTLGTGSTLNNVNFANYSCPTTVGPCIGAPPYLAAWWPFNDGPGSTSASDVTHAEYGRNAAHLSGGGSAMLPDAQCFLSPSDRATVPAAEQYDLGFGMGPLAIAAWLSPLAGGVGVRPVIEKRVPGTTENPRRGWALYLDGAQSFLELGTGSSPQVVPGPTLPSAVWSHVAVSVDRSTGHGRWYLNGDPVAALDFTPIQGWLPNDADVVIGQSNPAIATTNGFQGCIADLAVFSQPLTDAAAKKAYDPGNTGWCPEYAVLPKVRSFCQSDSSIQMCFNLVNQTGAPQTYQWSLAGLPIGPGCSLAGPTQILPSAGVVTVAAGGISPAICVTIRRPPGLVNTNATSCYQLTYINTATGLCRTATGKLRANTNCWCIQPPLGTVGVLARAAVGGVISVPVQNPCDPIALVQYEVNAEWIGTEHPDPRLLSLNGLPPGTPVTGTASNGQTIDIGVGYPAGFDFAARYEVVLSADTDGDGTLERVGGTIVRALYDSSAIVSTPAPAPAVRSTKLLMRPNPFTGGSMIEFALARSEDVTLGVYDLNGRLLRSLARGRVAAGPHRYAWDGRDARGRQTPAGIYFVRLTGERSIEGKLVKMR